MMTSGLPAFCRMGRGEEICFNTKNDTKMRQMPARCCMASRAKEGEEIRFDLKNDTKMCQMPACSCMARRAEEGEEISPPTKKDITVSQMPAFCSMVRGATGGGEIWSHTNEDIKMKQYGWRCTTNEDLYETDTLIGNYNEERFGLKEIKRNKPLPSPFEHYYRPIYAESYNKTPLHRYTEDLKRLRGPLPHAHPAHQPELDTPSHKAYCNSWQTTQRASYLHPRLRLEPIKGSPNEGFKHCQYGRNQ